VPVSVPDGPSLSISGSLSLSKSLVSAKSAIAIAIAIPIANRSVQNPFDYATLDVKRISS